MHLTVDGIRQIFTPIRDFCARHNLPLSFGITHFEPKDYTDLGRIDRAGAELNAVRAALLTALPERAEPAGWLAFLPALADLFRVQLLDINAVVGLKAVEIDFAVAGLHDALQAYAYALLRARAARTAAPDFRAVYGEWLDGTTRVFAQVYPYQHHDESWSIQVVATAYGRAGLIVSTPGATHYLRDASYGCPAEGFMTALLAEIAARMAG